MFADPVHVMANQAHDARLLPLGDGLRDHSHVGQDLIGVDPFDRQDRPALLDLDLSDRIPREEVPPDVWRHVAAADVIGQLRDPELVCHLAVSSVSQIFRS